LFRRSLLQAVAWAVGVAERLGQTDGWREFTLYRVAPERGGVAVTFALTGFGEARIDDVTIQPVYVGPLGTRPAVTSLPQPRRLGASGFFR
jgi:hypothetical protein